MVIKKREARHLLALLKSRRLKIDPAKANRMDFVLLEAAGLVRYPLPAEVELTYGGERIARALESLIDRGAIEEVESWDEHFRWIGSEILAMMVSSRRSDHVSALSLEPLLKRGLLHRGRSRERGRELWSLNREAVEILESFEGMEPRIVIDSELAQALLTSPAGPTESGHLPFDDRTRERLEAMRLIAYSVPDGEITLFTGLGEAVIEVLRHGAIATEADGEVIDPLHLDLLAEHYDGEELEDSARVELEMMGYLNDDGSLTPAGEAAMELRAMLKNRIETRLFSFALPQEHLETLLTIGALQRATLSAIRDELVDRKVKEFEELMERYGRRLDEMPLKKRQILDSFMKTKEKASWFGNHFDLHTYLYALEALDLVENIADREGNGVYRLTRHGEEVRDELGRRNAPVSSAAVKTLKLGRRYFSVPNREWVATARTQKLLGEFGPGVSGEFYRDLSERIERKPFLTRYEMEIFKSIPAAGMSLSDLLEAMGDEHEMRMAEEALDLLEARGLIEILADGNIVETEAGRLMDSALSGVPDGFGAPVNPTIYRVVKAVAETGTLYEKEKKIRLLPKHRKEAIRRSGLDPERFEKGWIAAREARFLGKSGVNEAGIDLLKAVEAMNP